MKPYPKYKDSGVAWIGDIPIDWTTIQIKRISSVKRGASPRPIADPKYFDDNGEYAWVRIADVSASNRYLENTTQQLSEIGSSLSVKQFPGDLFLSIAGTVGKPIITKIKCCIHDGFVYFPNLKINPEYLYYVFSTGEPYKGLGKWGTQLNLNTETVGYIPISLPPNEHEISRIVKYLDTKTAQIDNLISKKQKLIELLKEERAAIINQAVTKGLNPDAQMKDSGIEWIGEVPEHWEVKRLKYLAKIILGKMLTNVDKGGYHYRPYLRAQNINWEKVNIEDVKKMWFSKDELHQYRLNKNDLLVSEGGEAGRTGIWGEEIEECYIQNSVHKITMKPVNDPFFFLYTFCLYGEKGVFESVVSRISIAHLTKEKLKETIFPVPLNDEQERISKFIGTETTKIDQTISKIENQIDLLQEYRIALISEVVTGKIDVRDEGLNE